MKKRVTQATSLLSMVIMYIVYNNFDGLICGTLPFIPINMVEGISHRGLHGDDK